MEGIGRGGLIATVGAVLVLAGCNDTTPTPAPSPTLPNPPALSVGVRTEMFVDTGRRTDDPSFGMGSDSLTRLLKTAVFYPADPPSGAAPREQPPVRAGGPFPLVIFGHGNTVSDPASAYAGLLRKWANGGYVVAAPTFPVSSTRVPGGLADLVNQPADVSFVLTQLLQLSAAADGQYTGLIDPGRIAVAGHSLGGMTALGVTANTCCADDRITAAIVLAGEERSFGRGSFFTGSRQVPTMVVHGDADATIPFEAGHKLFTHASPPKVMLTLVGGDHGSPYNGDEGFGPARLVAVATIDFLDYYVRGQGDGLDRLRKAAADSPDARLEIAETAS